MTLFYHIIYTLLEAYARQFTTINYMFLCSSRTFLHIKTSVIKDRFYIIIRKYNISLLLSECDTRTSANFKREIQPRFKLS